MWSLGFTAARAETCEMATSWSWGWRWVLTSPLSPWSSSWLIPMCIPRQGQPAAHLLGQLLGLPGATAGNKTKLGNTRKPRGQSLERKFREETSCSLRSQVITLRICVWPLSPCCEALSSFPCPPGRPLGWAGAVGSCPVGRTTAKDRVSSPPASPHTALLPTPNFYHVCRDVITFRIC